MQVLKHHHLMAPNRRQHPWIAWAAALLAVFVCLSAWTAWHHSAIADAGATGVQPDSSLSQPNASLQDASANRMSSGMTAADFKRMYEGDSSTSIPFWYGF